MQSSKLFVGNLNYTVTTEELRQLFAQYGEVKDIRVIEGKGYGFVEMSSQSAADNAKNTLHNTEFRGRSLKIDNARPPKNKSENDRA